MPRRQKTGAKLLTTEQLMAVLNMTRDEIMVLVKNRIPHIKRNEEGKGVYYLFPDREVLAVVSPLPPNRALPTVEKPVVEDEEDEPIETVRPEPRMESTKPPDPPVTKKPETKPKAGTGKAPEKTKQKTKIKSTK